MKLKMQIRTLGFLYNLIKGNAECRLPSGKPLFTSIEPSDTFPESLPEQEGVRSDGLLKMFASISSDRRICPHSAIVLRNGRIIAKADWEPFSSHIPHVSHSLCKSITGMLVGIAINEKYLSADEKLTDIFGNAEKNLRDATLRNLLTMSTGVKFNEAGSLMSDDWVKSFLSSDTIFPVGSEFHYNSMNSYMLSAAICKRTGISLSEYASRHLFEPMGIGSFYWEKCPMGIEKGGWGLYLTAYDYAKLGQLWLENGIWNGTRLVPEEWIKISSSAQISNNDICRNGYGYQVWIGKHGYIFSGMFGQIVYVVPRENMVIVLTAGSENLFPCGGALMHIDNFLADRKYFRASPITHFHYSEAASLRKALSTAKFGMPLDVAYKKSVFLRLRSLFKGDRTFPADTLNGIEISFSDNRAHLLPLLIQVMEGCFGQGIEKAGFFTVKEHLSMKIKLKDGFVTIPLSFENGLNFIYKGYNVSSQAFFTSDEDGLPVLKIQLCFLETSCTKVMKFIFTEEGVTLKIRENPKLYNALDEAAELAVPQLGDNMRKTLEALLETDIAGYKIKNFIEPVIEGIYI